MLDDLTVFEIEGSVAGGYAAKLLADHGARVTTIQSETPPLPPPSSGMRRYLSRDKAQADQTTADQLRAADVVIRSSAIDPLSAADPDVTSDNPQQVTLEISPFGTTGPYASRRSSDLVDQAISGHLFLNGDPDRVPVSGPDHQVAYAAGAHGAIGVLAALAARRTTGDGQRVTVTHHQTMAALHQFTLLRYTHNGDILSRMGNRYAGPGRPIGMYPCGPGHISLVVPRGDQLETLLAVTDLLWLLDEPGIDGVYDVMHHPTLLDEHLVPWLATRDPEETIELFQSLRIPAGRVASLDDVLDDPGLAERGFWRTAPHDDENNDHNTSVRIPGPAAQISVGPTPGPRPDGTSTDLTDGPLAGVRVLDLTRVWAGPYCTRILADLGADVIMVEAPWARGGATIDHTSVMATRYYPDNDPGEHHWNRIGFSNKYNVNKRNIAVDLTTQDGRQILEALVAEADMLVENYSPRVMPNFGLDDARLHELNPSLIVMSMPGFGRTGPSRDHVAYGPMIDSQAGLSALMGYEGETARKAGIAWPDPVAGMHAAVAALVALHGRDTDSEARGRVIEVAQLEATVGMIGHAIADAQLTGQPDRPTGNRHRVFAPSGVYRCTGEDRWVAITVVDDDGWRPLVDLLDLDANWRAWSSDHRHQHHDAIDAAVAAWTASRTQHEVTAALQAIGVPAGPVADAQQVMTDPHLAAQGFYVALQHPDAGTHEWPRLPIELSATPATYRRPGPLLNEHATEILTDLGYDQATVEALYATGVISDRPPD
ncbi:MAG: CoA transferase [Actinomycetota bacterium]